MKTILKIASLALLVLQTCNADSLLDKLVGNWSGTATVKFQGQTINEKVVLVVTPLGKSGVKLKSTINIKGQPTSVGTTLCYYNGTCDGTLKRGGEVVGYMDGKWTKSTKFVQTTSVVYGTFPTYKSVSKTFLSSKNEIILTGSASNGATSFGSLKRR